MRMRRKKHRDERIAACSPLLLDKDEIFGESCPLFLEIGCGKGGFITELAGRNPGSRYIALEKVPDVALMAMERTLGEELTNIRFIIGGAERIPELPQLRPGTFDAIYLNFSDPWPKAGHYKRRLTYGGFLELYKPLLKHGGAIFFKTDNRPLFDFSLEQLAEHGFRLENITYDLHNSEYNADNIPTEYETNFSQKGFTINRVEAYLD